MLRTLSEDPRNAETDLSALDDGLTPTDRFYVRCNFAIPDLTADTWSLQLGGAFERRGSWSLAELRTLPPVERIVLLECAGNGRSLMSPVPGGTPWNLGAVSVARFGGIRLADLLASAGVRASAVNLVFTGADIGSVEPDGAIPYQFDLAVDRLATTDPILAWTMNDEPLAPDHGFPVRLVVPGDYGMRSVKWLTRIDAHEHGEFDAHFPRKYRYRGQAGVPDHTPVAEMRVRSLITTHATGGTLDAGAVLVGGIAWSGTAEIADVSALLDGRWHPARIVERIGTAAVRWEVEWEARPGAHEIAVSATDAAGNRQPEDPIWNEGGYGNNVIQRVRVEVR